MSLLERLPDGRATRSTRASTEGVAAVASAEAAAHWPTDSCMTAARQGLQAAELMTPRAVRARARRVSRDACSRTRRIAHVAVRPEHDLGLRGPADDPVPGPGDAAHRTHLRARGIAGGARRLQPADPGRQQLEGDAADRVPGRGASARSRSRKLTRHRGPLLGAECRRTSASWRSPTRTSSARTTRRPPRCTSCASSCPRPMRDALKGGAAVTIGIDHPHYRHAMRSLPRRQCASLRRAISPECALARADC